MSKLFLTALLLLTLLGVPCAASSITDDPTIEIPFSFEKGYVIVQAKIKGNVPVELVLESGAEHSRVDGGLLNKYKLPSFYYAEQPVTGRNDRLYTYSIVPDVRVGSLSGKSMSMRLDSFAEASQRVGREIFGSLGVDFFRGRVVQFDFKKKMVRFLSQSPDIVKDATGANSTRSAVLPMRVYKETLTLPIADNVTFDGKKIKTNFDTGMLTVVSLSASAAKQLNLTPPPENESPRPAKISSLRFAEHELKDVPILLYAKGSGFEKDDKDFDAVAGIALLQNFLVTFDFRKKVIILEQFK
jgi:hypothetical protein